MLSMINFQWQRLRYGYCHIEMRKFTESSDKYASYICQLHTHNPSLLSPELGQRYKVFLDHTVANTTMAEPQPASVQEGMDPEGPPAPTNAEDRKAAAAMSSLEARGGEDETKPNKQIDQEALGKAISRLELADKAGKVDTGEKGKVDEEKEEREKRAKIKVDQADVGLLVQELDLNKIKATELLRAHEGDAVRAMRAFVRATA